MGELMSEMRLVNAELKVSFCLDDGSFESEFSSSHNGLDEWMSMLKAKEAGDNTDPLTLKVLTEVLRKLENIENMLSGEGSSVNLGHKENANKIGYEGFAFENACLEPKKSYFANVVIGGFVHKNIKLFFEAVDEKTAKITRISKFDEKQWASNVARYEMGAIRAKKQKDNDEY